MYKRRPPKAPLDISLAPFIDVIFLLLCFFVVTTKFEDIHNLAIELPSSISETLVDENSFLEVSVTQAGDIRIDGTMIENITGQSITNQLLNYPTTTSILIKADKKTSHGEVVRLMDIITQAGFEQIHVASVATNHND